MKCFSVVCVLSALLAISLAAPAPIDETNLVPVHNQVKRQTDNSNSAALNRIIEFSNNKIQTLRRMFPQLFQIIDNVVQNVTSQVFRVVGGALLRSGGLGGSGGSSSGGGGGGRVSVVLPTFPPDEDEDDDDDDDDEVLNIQTNTNGTQANALSLLTDINEIDGIANLVSSENNSTNEVDSTTSATTSVVNLEEFMTSPSVTATRSERKVREANDQEAAASGGNGPNPAEDLSDVEAEESDRNKRFLPFGGDGQGSAGGSGNFLFDLIRLVAGSGATEESDEKSAGVGGVAEIDVSPKENGEGIPGPITRLLVIANRGIANLIQDLILRLAQTSERIVNFKARLVTALI